MAATIPFDHYLTHDTLGKKPVFINLLLVMNVLKNLNIWDSLHACDGWR